MRLPYCYNGAPRLKLRQSSSRKSRIFPAGLQRSHTSHSSMIYPASIWPIYFGAKGSVHDHCATSRMARRNCSRRARQGRFAVIDGARPPGSMFNERGGHGGSAGACFRRRLLPLLPPHNATRRRLQGQQRTHPTRASGLRASRPGRARLTCGDGKRAAARPVTMRRQLRPADCRALP